MLSVDFTGGEGMNQQKAGDALIKVWQLSFIVPLAAKPNMCYDAITPNDLHSDLTCGWSGSLLEAGAMAGVIWSKLLSSRNGGSEADLP